MNARIWLDGHLVERDHARCSLLSHALHYGTGVFEGIRCYRTPRGSAVFRLADHAERFRRGAEALNMSVDIELLTGAVLETLAAGGYDEAYIRPLAFYGTGGLGLDVAPLSLHLTVAALEWSSHLGARAAREGIRAKVSPLCRNPVGFLPPLKITGGYAHSVIAKLDATRSGYDEALFVDGQGRVCEATGENVFWARSGELFAVKHPDALPGITRATVIELTSAREQEVGLEELLNADEVFLTGTSAEITPLRQLDGTPFSIGPVTRRVQDLYRQAVRGELPERGHWLTLVPPRPVTLQETTVGRCF